VSASSASRRLCRAPYDLEAFDSVIEFQKAKYRFADPVDALVGIDSRPDLLKMDWYRFENRIPAAVRGTGTVTGLLTAPISDLASSMMYSPRV
jgi:hypothetical protein